MVKMVVVTLTVLLFFVTSCPAEQINMATIAQIESSNNPSAYNIHSKATGLYQITPICLEDYNAYHVNKLRMDDMFNRYICHKVAYWYINIRIPQLLQHYGYEDTVERRLVAYNAGISRVRYYDPPSNLLLPRETRDYIKKYNEAIKW